MIPMRTMVNDWNMNRFLSLYRSSPGLFSIVRWRRAGIQFTDVENYASANPNSTTALCIKKMGLS